jgi:hypothetical protein
MPYYRDPRVHDLRSPHNTSDQTNAVTNAAPHIDEAAAALLTNIITLRGLGHTSLGIRPVIFSTFHTPKLARTDQPAQELYNPEFPALTYSVMGFQWVAYGFNSGHFISIIKTRNLPFSIVLACDPYAHGRALFNEVAKCQNELHGASAFLDHICASDNASPIDGYIIHTHCYQSSKPSTAFWSLQASIVENLFAICKLQLFIAFVHPDHDGRSVTKFVRQLHPGRWVISRTTCSFPDYGNSVVGGTTVIVGVHNSTQSKVEPLLFKTPPTCCPLTLSSFIWPPFNKTEYQLSYAMNVI